MRKLVYYVATTADGFIAAEDGSFDAFLQEGEQFADLIAEFPETFPGHARGPLGITGPNRRFDAVLMGRATWAVGLPHGMTSPYPHLAQYVFSTTLGSDPDPAVQLVQSDPVAFVRGLKADSGRDIWLCGGGRLAAALFPVIDELVLKQNPVLLGRGIPLFAGRLPPTRLALLERKGYANGYTRLHYAIDHGSR